METYDLDVTLLVSSFHIIIISLTKWDSNQCSNFSLNMVYKCSGLKQGLLLSLTTLVTSQRLSSWHKQYLKRKKSQSFFLLKPSKLLNNTMLFWGNKTHHWLWPWPYFLHLNWSAILSPSNQGKKGCEDHVKAPSAILCVCASTQKLLYLIS